MPLSPFNRFAKVDCSISSPLRIVGGVLLTLASTTAAVPAMALNTERNPIESVTLVPSSVFRTNGNIDTYTLVSDLASSASIGVGNPFPVSNYTCEDGTNLAVRMLGESTSVSVNDTAEVELPAIGTDGTTFSDGHMTLTIVQGSLFWSADGSAPSACSDV